MSCLDENTVAAYLMGGLTPARVDEVDAHLEGCAGCRELVGWAARAVQPPVDLRDAGATPGSPDAEEGELRRGSSVGRYLLLGPIGRGAMGVVWSAYDPELERKVAIKLMRPDREQDGSETEVAARITREAQALARLSHPNVIAVYDVGVVERRVFIAMEQVNGATLTDWLRAEPRSTIEILDVFHQAGLGLAAAHAAGLVHRDFKPANMLVGTDRRVRVVDFGLARATTSLVSRPSLAIVPEAVGATDATRTGALLGTPAYMAPEQRDGRRPDARADQYSLCVALCEALTGTRPQDGRDPALRDRRVASWLRKLLARGLEHDRALRFPSMSALLAAMERDPAAIRARWIGVMALLLLVVVGGGALRVALRDRRGLCGDAERRLEGVWDAKRRRALQASFGASKAAYAPDALAGSSALLDRFALAWSAMYRDSCEATRLRGEQSEELLDLRMACLSDRLVDLQAASDLLLSADPSVVRNAVSVAGNLPAVSDCADAKVLRGVVRPPRDEASKHALEEVADKVAVARALEAAGEYDKGMAAARSAVAQAQLASYPPVLAEALLVRGELEHDLGNDALAEHTLLDAALAAEQGRDDRGVVRARIALVISLIILGRSDEALRWSTFAEAGLERIGEDPLLRARVYNVRGRVLDSLGRWEESRRALEQMLKLRQQVLGPAHRDVGVAFVNLGVVAHDQGRLEDALAYYQGAYTVFERALGASHPDLATTINNIGNTLADLGREAEAITWLERALALRVRTLGPSHRSSAASHMDLGHTLRRSGALDRALAEEQLALATAEKVFAPDHPWLAFPLVEIGEVQLARALPERALPLLERALALPPRKRPQKPEVKFPLARALWESGQDRHRAEVLLGEAYAAYDPALPADARSRKEIVAWAEAHHVSVMP